MKQILVDQLVCAQFFYKFLFVEYATFEKSKGSINT